jgi:hypothetical protein
MKPDLSKLPKYAQNYISLVERERDEAVEKARRLRDTQTKTEIWVDDYGADREHRREYVQGDIVIVAHAGVCLRVDASRERGIELSWSEGDTPYGTGEVAFIPTSHQAARLTNIDQMHTFPKVTR